MTKQSIQKKVRVGWFSFTCSEDNTIVFTEILNDHWKEWKHLLDFRHARALKSKNVLDEMHIAFVEGAISSETHAERLREIRKKSKILVAIGACAVTGLPSAQRNDFDEKTKEEIRFILNRFAHLPKVLKVADVVKVDASVPGCPIDPDNFLEALNKILKELGFSK